MLVLEVIRYLKRRADKTPVDLANFIDMESHGGVRTTEPSVAIIIPTRDKHEILKACIESIQQKTVYRNYEIVVINNASTEPRSIEYLNSLKLEGVRVLDYPEAFNYSKIINFGVSKSESEYVCLLNNDTEVVEPNWLGRMMDHAVLPTVGVVGSKLLYRNGSIQHLGIAMGYRGLAGHPFTGIDVRDLRNPDITNKCFSVSAVTFACAITSSTLFKSLGGLDETLKVGLNDVDYCQRIMGVGYSIVLCGQSSLVHLESQSRKNPMSVRGFVPAAAEILRYLRKHAGPVDEQFFNRLTMAGEKSGDAFDSKDPE